MKKESWRKILWVTIFAIAMGFLETVVVVYLRKIFYTGEFDFPLKGFIEPQIIGIEWVREFATIIMLITIGILAGKKFYEKIAYFLYAFAIWDVFYYIFLKILLDWPASLLTWDILFLIPLPWIGPVLAPVMCAILMIITALMIINFEDKGIKIKLKATEIILGLIALFLILYTWLYDYSKIIIYGNYAKDFFTLSTNEEFMQIIGNYIPSYYNWPVFLIGFVFAVIGILMIYLRLNKN